MDESLINQELERVRRRLDSLDQIEQKLRQMRELAIYAAGRSLNEKERIQVQEWIDILKEEVNALDQEALWTEETKQ